MTTDVELPERIPVIIGKNIFHMESESLIASLVHQTIHKNNLLYNSDDFAMIFDVTKIEITNFLRKKLTPEFEAFDFFDNWMTEFDEFQIKKNKTFCKDLIITFPDKLQFTVKLLDVISLRNVILDKDENDVDDDDPILNDPQLLLDWIDENLDWEQLSPYAEYVKTDRQENTRNKNFLKATKKIVEWERHLSIFDFISKGDMILTSDEDDDED
jgi:hypothetical protein